MFHLYYAFYTFIFCKWYLLVYYDIFCPALNKDFHNNNNNTTTTTTTTNNNNNNNNNDK